MYRMRVRRDFFITFGCVRMISNENVVDMHSLNYTGLYEIDGQTCGIFSCIRVRCTHSLECGVYILVCNLPT